MREIKFRAWQEDAVEKDLRFWTWKEMLEHDLNVMVNNPKYKIMQYTGLKDKNGVEIYEYNELDGAYEVIFQEAKYVLRHISNNVIIDLYDYWRGKNGEVEVTREYTKV